MFFTEEFSWVEHGLAQIHSSRAVTSHHITLLFFNTYAKWHWVASLWHFSYGTTGATDSVVHCGHSFIYGC